LRNTATRKIEGEGEKQNGKKKKKGVINNWAGALREAKKDGEV